MQNSRDRVWQTWTGWWCWKRDGVYPKDIKTEVFFIPAAAVAEKAGSFTNTQRMVQWHDKAVDPPGDARSDLDFVYDLGKRLKKLYAGSTDPKDRPILDMTWDYGEHEADPYLVMKEINGYTVADKKPVKSFVELKDDGTTAAGGWIYSGIIPEEGKNLAASRNPDNYVSLGWGFAWPANRRILYNRASADPSGKPWSERKKYIWWDPEADAGGGKKGKWVGYDIPDFPATKPPDAPAKPDGFGLDAHSGADPFIMKVDGKGWLFAPSGLLDGPLPTHYEPMETPVENPMYKQQVNPVVIRFDVKGNEYIKVADPNYPIVISTYRLTEHHLSGTMSRWLPWLAELQPELFVEISPELAGEKGIQNGDWVTVITPRAEIEAKALVTRRLRPFRLGDGKIIHQIGMPWHWGYQGVVKGDIVNNLSALVGDPNVTIHEGKVFTCNIRKGRKQRTANV
jgi:formate dehydrogenase major subunit